VPIRISSVPKLTAYVYSHRKIEINAYSSKSSYQTDYKVGPKLGYNKKHRRLAANKQTNKQYISLYRVFHDLWTLLQGVIS